MSILPDGTCLCKPEEEWHSQVVEETLMGQLGLEPRTNRLWSPLQFGYG
jgi:hypothetical protein